MSHPQSTARSAWLTSRHEPQLASLPNQQTNEQSSATQGQLLRFPDRSLSIVTDYLVDTKGQIASGRAIFSNGWLRDARCSVPNLAGRLLDIHDHRFTKSFLRHPGSKYSWNPGRAIPEDDLTYLKDRLSSATKFVLKLTHAPRSARYAGQCFVDTDHHATALTSKPLVDIYNFGNPNTLVSTEVASGTIADQVLWSAHLPMASRRVIWSSTELEEPRMINGHEVEYMVKATWECPTKEDWMTIQYDPKDTPGSYTRGASDVPPTPSPSTPALTIDEPPSPEAIAELMTPIWPDADHGPTVIEDGV